MSELVSVEKIIELIKSLSPSDRDLLFSELQARGMGKPREGDRPYPPTEPLELGNATCDISRTETQNFWGDEGTASYQVLLKKEANETVSATLFGWSDCKVYGKTRSQALQQLQDLVNQQLVAGEIVSIKLKSTQPNHPLLQVPTTLKNNPLFDEVLGYMEAYRRELDAELETSDRELEVGANIK